MFSFGRKVVKVTFREQASRAVISTVRMPLERLPDTIATGSELKMSGAHYVIVSADPATKDKAADIGHLDITVRKR